MPGWIKIHRKILEWEWYDDVNTFKLFMHLILTANHAPKNWRGQTIERGQKLTSRAKLSEETKLSERQIRTCMERLKSTNEVTINATNKQTVITLCNYDSYQIKESPNDQQNDQQAARPATSKRPANDQATNKKGKNDKKEKAPPASDDAADFLLSKRNRKLKGKRLDAFNKFWDSFSLKRGKAEAIDAWLDIPSLTDAIVEQICNAAATEAKARPGLIEEKKTPKWAQGWITGRRWEDEDEATISKPNGKNAPFDHEEFFKKGEQTKKENEEYEKRMSFMENYG